MHIDQTILTQYLYIGPTANLGRFGSVTTGQTLSLTPDEVDTQNSPQASPNLILKPVANKARRAITGAYQVLQADAGRLLTSNITAPVTATLIAAPTLGTNLEFIHEASATATLTLDPGTIAIDGVVATFALTVALNRKGLIYTSAGWISY